MIGANQLEELNSLHNCEVLLLANIELFAVLPLVLNKEVVIFKLNHFVSANLTWILFGGSDRIHHPGVLVDLAPVEVTLLEHRFLGFDLEGEAFMLIYHHPTVFLDHLFAQLKSLAAFGNEKH